MYRHAYKIILTLTFGNGFGRPAARYEGSGTRPLRGEPLASSERLAGCCFAGAPAAIELASTGGRGSARPSVGGGSAHRSRGSSPFDVATTTASARLPLESRPVSE